MNSKRNTKNETIEKINKGINFCLKDNLYLKLSNKETSTKNIQNKTANENGKEEYGYLKNPTNCVI